MPYKMSFRSQSKKVLKTVPFWKRCNLIFGCDILSDLSGYNSGIQDCDDCSSREVFGQQGKQPLTVSSLTVDSELCWFHLKVM
ncbi:hypothetical protein Ancab_015974 [Ancistrocladus abbreviatus]